MNQFSWLQIFDRLRKAFAPSELIFPICLLFDEEISIPWQPRNEPQLTLPNRYKNHDTL